MRVGAVLTAAALATLAAATGAGADSGTTITPSRETVADPFRTGSEPSVAIAPDGSVYESQIWGFTTTQSFLQRSLDGGDTFNTLSLAPGQGKLDECTGGGDSSIATGTYPGDIWMIDLGVLPEVPARVSNNHGNSWSSSCLANFADGVNFFADRQWLSTDLKNRKMIYLYRDTEGTTGEFIKAADLPTGPGTAGSAQIDFRSLCLNAQGVAAACVRDTSTGGPPVTDNTPTSPGYGTTYMPQAISGGVNVVRIRPDDATKKVDETPKIPTSVTLFPVAAVDRAGTVYLAWTDASTGQFDVHYTYSTDQGQTWAPARIVNSPDTNVATTVMPAIVAGDDGKIDIAYYGSSDTADPTSNNGPWFLDMDQIFGANTADPVQTHVVMSDRPVHNATVCLSGLACATKPGPAGDRQLGDFFSMALDKDGRAVITYNDGDNQLGKTSPGGALPAPSFADLVRQATGPSLYGGNVPPLATPTNSVSVADHHNPVPLALPTGASGADNDSLKLLGSSTSYDADGNLVITLHVKKLDAIAAVTPPALPVATFMTRFIHHDAIYAISAETEGGQWRYFAGPAAGLVAGNTGVKAAYYPAATAVTGSVDPATNTIRITVPASAVGSPAKGDTLYSVTSYALTHAVPTAPIPPQAENYTDWPQIADVLPAYNVSAEQQPTLPETSLTIALPLVALLALATSFGLRRRSVRRAAK